MKLNTIDKIGIGILILAFLAITVISWLLTGKAVFLIAIP